MKKTQLIEWGIVTIGLIFGFKFLESVFGVLVYIVYNLQDGYGDPGNTLTSSLGLTAFYAVVFVVVIRQSRSIAIYLSGSTANEAVPLRIGKRSLLHVVLIAICVASIISQVPTLLIYLFESFRDEAGGRRLPVYDANSVTKYAFKVAAVQTIVSLAVLYFSKDISGWFIRKNEVDELIFESEAENKE